MFCKASNKSSLCILDLAIGDGHLLNGTYKFYVSAKFFKWRKIVMHVHNILSPRKKVAYLCTPGLLGAVLNHCNKTCVFAGVGHARVGWVIEGSSKLLRSEGENKIMTSLQIRSVCDYTLKLLYCMTMVYFQKFQHNLKDWKIGP